MLLEELARHTGRRAGSVANKGRWAQARQTGQCEQPNHRNHHAEITECFLTPSGKHGNPQRACSNR